MTNNPLGSQYGTLIMSGWIGTDPRDRSDMPFLYLATPSDGSLGIRARDTMAKLAQALGFDPQPGSMTQQPNTGVYLTVTDDWVRVVMPSWAHVEHPGSPEIRRLARTKGQAVLTLSYLPLPSGVDIGTHKQHTIEQMACASGLVPVR